jgi:GNAT superfamily N-acetyltransferase
VTTPDDTAPIRLAAPQDAKTLQRLALMAFSRLRQHYVDGMEHYATKQQEDDLTVDWMGKQDTSIHVPGVRSLRSLRVIGEPDRKARAMIYCVPPGDWIISQGRPSKGAMSIEDRALLSGAVVELNLLATLPEWRGRGFAGRLLDDAEDRYRAAGYRVMLVVIDREHPEVIPWYRRRGYTVGQPDQHGLITLWSDRLHKNLRYGGGEILPGQRLAAKALDERVTVSDLRGMVKVAGLFDGLPPFTPAVPEPVMQP